MRMAKRIVPAELECIHNRDYTITWDSDDIVFVIDSPKVLELANINKHAKEFVVYNPRFEFQCPYVGYETDWHIFDAI